MPRSSSTATAVPCWTPPGNWAIDWTASATGDFLAYLSDRDATRSSSCGDRFAACGSVADKSLRLTAPLNGRKVLGFLGGDFDRAAK
jgi:hypothetical protein